jgi:dTDP-4-amino-4,6-dideoxygalactose transaminase
VEIKGLKLLNEAQDVTPNYSYFPIFIDENDYGLSRDQLYEKLKERNIFGRRYFYPLISNFSTYNKLPSSCKKNLYYANRVAGEVICLPMHHGLSDNDADEVINVIKNGVRDEFIL